MRRLLFLLLWVAAAIAPAQQVAGTGELGPLGSVIGYNAAGSNWLYVPVDSNGYLLVDCAAGCSGSSGNIPAATAGGQVPAAPAAGTTYQASQECVDATLYAGADLNAQLSAAYAALPTYTDLNGQSWANGCLRVPFSPTGYSVSSTLTINSPFVSVYYDETAPIYYTGSGDYMRVQQTQLSSGTHYKQPSQGTQIWNLNLINQSATGVSGIHAGDMYGIGLHHVSISGFNDNSGCTGPGGATNAALWFDNVLLFTEGLDLDHVNTYDNCIGAWFTNSGGGSSHNSFGYGVIRRTNFGVRANEIGVEIDPGSFVYHQAWEFVTEGNNASSYGMYVAGTFGGVTAQQGGDNYVVWRDECVGCGTPMSMLTVVTGGVFRSNGLMSALNNTATITNSGGSFLWSGTSEPGTTLNFLGFQTDGGLRGYYSNAVAWNLFANNWRLQGGATILNLGWTTNPTSGALFLGISPKSNGSTTLCVNQGTTGTCTGLIEAAQETLNGLIGSDGLVCSISGLLGTAGCPSASFPSNTSGQLLIGQGGTSFTPQTLSQDCTITSAGVVTCLKTNNVAFGTAATKSTGTSGNNVPLMGLGNTWSGQQSSTLPWNYTASGSSTACSTSGTASFTQPQAGTGHKQIIIFESACLGTATITFTTAFANAPAVLTSAISSTVGTPSTTAVTVTGTTSTGNVVIEGW